MPSPNQTLDFRSSQDIALPLPESAPPGMKPRLTFKGEIRVGVGGDVPLYADHADEAGSLLQIEPGQWVQVKQDPGAHSYTYEPLAGVDGPVRIHFDRDALVDKYLVTPSQVSESLSSSMTWQLDVPTPVAVGGLGGGRLGLAGAALGVCLVGLMLSRKLLQRRARYADLLREMGRIRLSGRVLRKAIRSQGGRDVRSWSNVPQLLDAAERVFQQARELRDRQRRAGLEQVRAEVDRLRQGGHGGQMLAEKERQLSMLEPMVTSERALTTMLSTIRATLESLETAWVTEQSPDLSESHRAEDLLDSVSREIGAAVATRQELQRLQP